MGFNGNVWGEIGKVRHFFAHRSAHTEAEARKLASDIGLVQFVDCETLVSMRRPGSPIPIFEQWTLEVDRFFEAALA